MDRRWSALGLAMLLAACGAQSQDAMEGHDAESAAAALACAPQAPWEEVTGRASPYDSAMVAAGGLQAKVCYSRPFVKGRTIFGAEGEALVPFGKLWRTGANEPTTIHVASAARIAGVPVEPGSYSIYTVPAATEWTIVVNRSISQWGHESRYTPEVEAQEVGRGTVAAESLEGPVEQFTIRTESEAAGAADLVLEWATSRIRVPVRSM